MDLTKSRSEGARGQRRASHEPRQFRTHDADKQPALVRPGALGPT